jgi:hypothetical protein
MRVFGNISLLLLLSVVTCLSRATSAPYVWRVPSEHPSICGSVDSAAYGDTVLVAPGTYERERDFVEGHCTYSWIVMKDGLTLMSEGGAEETVLLEATGQTETTICCDSIVDAQIIGFSIRDQNHGCGSCAIVVEASNVEIIDNDIDNFCHGIGVWLDPVDQGQSLILRNTVHGSCVGIDVYSVPTNGCLKIQGNRIRYCLEAGIRIQDASPIVVSNTVEHVSLSGIMFYGASETALKRNTINNNAVAVDIYCDDPARLPSLNPYGSARDANDLCGNSYCVNTHGGPASIWAMYNYWGCVCPDPSRFSANVAFLPWFADSAHTCICGNCETCQPATEPRSWGSIKALFR